MGEREGEVPGRGVQRTPLPGTPPEREYYTSGLAGMTRGARGRGGRGRKGGKGPPLGHSLPPLPPFPAPPPLPPRRGVGPLPRFARH